MEEKLLDIRKKVKAKKPKFTMQDNHKKGKLKNKWKRPKGIDSKMRLNLKGYKTSPSKGYKSPTLVRGLNAKGIQEVIVNSLKDLDMIKNEEQGALISGTVGVKKKVEILKKTVEKGIQVLNVKDPENYIKQIEESAAKKKAEKEEKKKQKESKKKEKEKKAEEKEKKAEEKEKKDKEGEGAGEKDELTSKIEEAEKKKEEKKELDKKLIHSE